MFWKRKHKVEATELAQSLLNEFVDKIVGDVAKDLRLDAVTTARYKAKTRLYQLAAVLMAVMGEERRNPRFLAVREHLERNVFPSSPDEGARPLEEVRTAMLDLNNLITPPGQQREMSWARAWLQDIGLEETNPVTLALFATHWLDYYIIVVDALREFKLVV